MLNKRTHEGGCLPWALGVDFPKRVTSSGGRYQFQDDLVVLRHAGTSLEYEDKCLTVGRKELPGKCGTTGGDRGSANLGRRERCGGFATGMNYDRTARRRMKCEGGRRNASGFGRARLDDGCHFGNFIAEYGRARNVIRAD